MIPLSRIAYVSTLYTELHQKHEGVVLKVHLSTYDDTSPINTITIENLFACSHDTDNVVVFFAERAQETAGIPSLKKQGQECHEFSSSGVCTVFFSKINPLYIVVIVVNF